MKFSQSITTRIRLSIKLVEETLAIGIDLKNKFFSLKFFFYSSIAHVVFLKKYYDTKWITVLETKKFHKEGYYF